MTNYEWLVKSGKLESYILGWLKNAENHLQENNRFAADCAKWLQEEHREKKKYVAFDDVLDILRMPRSLVFNKHKPDVNAIVEMLNKQYFCMQTALFNLETKEIEE